MSRGEGLSPYPIACLFPGGTKLRWNMKQWSYILKNLSLLTQLGLSLLTPTLLCLVICYFLQSRFGLGAWIYIPGFFFGLGGSFTVAKNFYNMIEKQQKKEDQGRGDKPFFKDPF